MKCKNCNKRNLIKIVKIGKQPLSGFFYKKKKKNLKKFSLDLFKCSDCDLVQLNNKVKIGTMYGAHYGYQTSISKLMIDHLKEKAQRLKKSKIIQKQNKILDIGSNDASFLRLIGNNFDLYGIDPSAKKFKKYYNGIKLIPNFFSKKNVIKSIKNPDIKFDLISSFAIFYDVENPNSFCEDIHSLLNDDGIWICEFSYLPLMLKNLTFDQICHEHLMYYSLSVFDKILKKNNLRIIDVKLNEINGGSIEVIISKNTSKRASRLKLINQLKNDEKKINKNSYKNFSIRVNKVKNDLNFFVRKNRSIIGYGASTKGNVILNFSKLDEKRIKYICDENKKKHNKFTPGSNIKIISKDEMRKMKPKYLLVLIWSFRPEIIKQELNFLKRGGSLIFYLPKFHIVNKFNYKKYLKSDFKPLSFSY